MPTSASPGVDGQKMPLLKCDYADDEISQKSSSGGGGGSHIEEHCNDINTYRRQSAAETTVVSGGPFITAPNHSTAAANCFIDCNSQPITSTAAVVAATAANTSRFVQHEPILTQICCQQICSCSSDSDTSVATTSADCGGSLDSAHLNSIKSCHHRIVCSREALGGGKRPRNRLTNGQTNTSWTKREVAGVNRRNGKSGGGGGGSSVIEDCGNNLKNQAKRSGRPLSAGDIATQTEELGNHKPAVAAVSGDGGQRTKVGKSSSMGGQAACEDNRPPRKHSKHMIIFNLDDKNKFTEEITV